MSYAWLKKQGVTDEDIKENMPYSPEPEVYSKPVEEIVPEVWSGDGKIRTHEQCVTWANTLNYDIKYPDSYQLFIDIDSELAWKRFLVLYDRFDKILGLHTRSSWSPSKSGLPKRHVIVYLSEQYDLPTRIAFQAILGSDPMRELISMKRALNDENPDTIVCFFEPKVVAQP